MRLPRGVHGRVPLRGHVGCRLSADELQAGVDGVVSAEQVKRVALAPAPSPETIAEAQRDRLGRIAYDGVRANFDTGELSWEQLTPITRSRWERIGMQVAVAALTGASRP